MPGRKKLHHSLSILTLISVLSLALGLFGCTGKGNLRSPETRQVASSDDDNSDTRTATSTDEKERGPLSYRFGKTEEADPDKIPESDSKSSVGSSPGTAENRSERFDSTKAQIDSASAFTSHRAASEQIYSLQIYNEDSASAVDDDIWRRFDLADEYYQMAVVANREASWEEAQYYFDKALMILANLDVETDSLLTPEAVKYNNILDNIVADYRITLRSLGRLEEDIAPSVLMERFNNLQDRLGLDSIRIFAQEKTRTTFDLPVVMNDRVKKSIVYFQTVAKDAFRKYLSRSKRYSGLYSEVLAEDNMPQDLIYLSLVESGFNPAAYSWARAMGLWQFIASTGRMYNLNRSWWVDERKDPRKATIAAARYLRDLYKQFGHWELAMAAYNGGPGRVRRTIKKQGTRDFWKLKLKRQTMDYVPLIYAAAIIAKDPEVYGFTDIEFENPVVWEEVTIDRCLDLKVVAKELGCSYSELKTINPELLRQYTPPNTKKYLLKIPVGKKKKFFAAYDDMPSPKETSWVKHRIRRGETVSTIASRYGVSQYAIFAANNLSRRSRIFAGKQLIVPVPLGREYNSKPKKNRTYDSDGSIYSVRSGDTMWDIAKAFGTTVDALRRVNAIGRGSRIYVGQKLKLPSNAIKNRKNKPVKQPTYASKSLHSKTDSKGKSSGSVKHKVRSGDTLWDIARKYGTTTGKIRRNNGLGRSSRIYPGQILNINAATSGKYV
ncbi:MAG: LysM peptidoglycan-binding domain-containing protein, partial [candidate division Zixibacteria bacterium]